MLENSGAIRLSFSENLGNRVLSVRFLCLRKENEPKEKAPHTLGLQLPLINGLSFGKLQGPRPSLKFCTKLRPGSSRNGNQYLLAIGHGRPIELIRDRTSRRSDSYY